MDEIVDPIRNCSLDVDAKSTNFSDTSANFNQPTVLSFNVITNEYSSKIEESFDIPKLTLQQAAFVQPVSEKFNTIITPTNEIANATAIKKPSYLNLACCVNGYSYLTTYDSKLRQNINNSREVSPIRPGSNIVQNCKGLGNLLTSPCMKTTVKQPYKQYKGYAMESQSKLSNESDITVTNGKYLKENNCKSSNIVSSADETDQSSKTFIQQRVERLYGIEAISKGVYSPKTSRSPQEKTILCERSSNSVKLNTHSNKTNDDDIKNGCRNVQNMLNKDLPVFRHLRPEFRAQLPISPSKQTEDNMRVLNLENNDFQSCHLANNNKLNENKLEFNTITTSLNQNNINKTNNMELNLNNNKISTAEIISNFENISDTLKSATNMKNELKNKTTPQDNIENKSNGTKILDGNYFLGLLKSEQCRLLSLASTAEVEIEELSKNSEISEDILGFLRSAAGKARLLVSQKMKQFEGLCLKNLTPDSGDKFLTTISDLQGFWDMVKLQVDDIDSIFKEIELLKHNDWKRSDVSVCLVPSGSKLIRRPIISSNLKNKKINPKDLLATEANGANVNKSNTTSLAAQKREIQRKQLMELKRKNKIALAAEQHNTENASDIIVNEIAS